MVGNPVGCQSKIDKTAQCLRVLTTALVLITTLAADAAGRRLLEVDGIELHGAAQLVMSGGGTCNVLESDTSYEARKGNHGASMDIWRLDFSVLNASGRWLDHLIARYQIESKWPECTNWDGPGAGVFSQNIEWADSAGHIQKSGRNVVAPGRTLNATHLFIVLRGDPEPRFANWSMDFDFAASRPPVSGSTVSVPVASAEQETVFWQSIVNSTNPADFEAYLRQFPQGVFRALAQNRLAALRDPGGDLPTVAAAVPAPPPLPEPLCDDEGPTESWGKWQNCWHKLSSPAGCYMWVDDYDFQGHPDWTGECVHGIANGSGTLTVKGWHQVTEEEKEWRSTGAFRNGKEHGHWADTRIDGWVEEGPYVDGKRHGRWIDYGLDKIRISDPLIRVYENGEQTDSWWFRDRR